MLKSIADVCDRKSCVCSTHGADYLKVAEERVRSAHHKVDKARLEGLKQQDLFLGIEIAAETIKNEDLRDAVSETELDEKSLSVLNAFS